MESVVYDSEVRLEVLIIMTKVKLCPNWRFLVCVTEEENEGPIIFK